MPSPLGHALGGVIAGWLVAGTSERAARGETSVRQSSSFALRVRESLSLPRALAFAAVGMAPDLDLLIGRHSQFTHSVSFAVAIGLGAYALLRLRRVHPAGMLALAVAAAYGSHITLDWLGRDATPPLGIMALWPFSLDYHQSAHGVFWGISRQPWRPGAAWHNLLAIGREVLLLGPLVVGAWWLRRPARHILPSTRATDRQPLPSTRRAPADGESQ